MNPYKNLPIYGPKVIKDYEGRYIYENPPHIYAIAESAYTNMRNSGSNCCVIISGESGAGKVETFNLNKMKRFVSFFLLEINFFPFFLHQKKLKTENSKKIMEYITAVSKNSESVAKVKSMLLESNPILEAFGLFLF